VVNHHGLAYGLEVQKWYLELIGATLGWPDVYHLLRYGPPVDSERVLLRDGKRSLERLRKL